MVKVKVKIRVKENKVKVWNADKKVWEERILKHFEPDVDVGYSVVEINYDEGWMIIELLRSEDLERIKDKVIEVIEE